MAADDITIRSVIAPNDLFLRTVFSTIIAVAQRIPGSVLHEDPKLLRWYDRAVTRSGGQQ